MASSVVAIDFGATKTAVALATPDGEIVRRVEMPTTAGDGAISTVQRAVAAARALIAEVDSPPLGVGVASMGVTLEDRVLLAPNVSGWSDLALPLLLRSAFSGIPVRIENDMKAATFAELRWGALRDVQNGIYVNLGTGIGVGLVVGGRVLRGAHGAAGEIAYNPRTPRDELGAPAGHAPLEEQVGGAELVAQAMERFGLDPAELFARYHSDAEVRRFVDGYLHEISFHLACLAIALDPSRIVLGAGLMRSGAIVLPAIARRIAAFTPFPVEVVPARFAHDAALVGAVALATQEMPSL